MYRRVLLIDDEPTFLRSLALYLEDAGHQVLTQTDANLALEVLHTNQPDAIICDLRMPGMGGIEFFHEMRKNPKWQAIPFILLTGAMERTVLDHSAGCGIYRILGKPFDPEDLVAILNREDGSASMVS